MAVVVVAVAVVAVAVAVVAEDGILERVLVWLLFSKETEKPLI